MNPQKNARTTKALQHVQFSEVAKLRSQTQIKTVKNSIIFNETSQHTHSLDSRKKKLDLSDTLSRKTPRELLARNTTVKTPENTKNFLDKDEISTD